METEKILEKLENLEKMMSRKFSIFERLIEDLEMSVRNLETTLSETRSEIDWARSFNNYNGYY